MSRVSKGWNRCVWVLFVGLHINEHTHGNTDRQMFYWGLGWWAQRSGVDGNAWLLWNRWDSGRGLDNVCVSSSSNRETLCPSQGQVGLMDPSRKLRLKDRAKSPGLCWCYSWIWIWEREMCSPQWWRDKMVPCRGSQTRCDPAPGNVSNPSSLILSAYHRYLSPISAVNRVPHIT